MRMQQEWDFRSRRVAHGLSQNALDLSAVLALPFHNF
jgi:hypothetical protein